MVRVSALALTAVFLIAFQANAQMRRDNWPNWYIGLSGQVNFVSDADVSGSSNGEITYDIGHAFTGAIGYRPYFTNSILDNFRFELEGQYRDANFDTFDAGAGSVSLEDDLTSYAMMFNTYYDFYTGTSLTPYIGGGLGIAWWDFDSTALAGGSDVNAVFAYQFMTGFYFSPRSLPDTDWGVGYRYFGSADPSFENATGQGFDTEYSSHNLEFLARFRF